MGTGTAEETVQATGTAGEESKVPSAGTGLDGDKGRAEGKPERTYRQSEVDALLGKAGQRVQAKLDAITTERDALKGQLVTVTTEIAEAKESIASLTTDIETMSDGDPDKQTVLKLRKAKEAELKALKAERDAILPEKQEVAKFKRDQLVYTVADDYVKADGKPVDLNSFMTAADRFKLSVREELETLADTLGFKPKDEAEGTPKTPPVKAYSGRSEGGGEDIGSLPPLQRMRAAEAKLRAK